MDKRRIIGISYREDASALIDKQVSLMDKNISKIFYIDVDGEEKTVLDYATANDFHTDDGGTIDPESYAPARVYVNCFLAEARLGGVKRVVLPRADTSIPIFGENATMIILGAIGGEEVYLYVNNDIGVIKISIAVLRMISKSRTFSVAKLNELCSDYERDTADSLKAVLTKVDTWGFFGKVPTPTTILDYKDESLAQAWIARLFMGLFEQNEWYSNNELTPFDLVCKKFADGPKEELTESEAKVVAFVCHDYIGLPQYNNEEEVKILKNLSDINITGVNGVTRQNNYQNDRDALVWHLQEAFTTFWNSLLDQRKDGYFGVKAQRTESSENGLSGARQENVGLAQENGTQGRADAWNEALAVQEQQGEETGLEGENDQTVFDTETEPMEVLQVDSTLLGAETVYQRALEDTTDDTDKENTEQTGVEPVFGKLSDEEYEKFFKGQPSTVKFLTGIAEEARKRLREEEAQESADETENKKLPEYTEEQQGAIGLVLSELDTVSDVGECLELFGKKPDDEEEETLSFVGAAKERLGSQLITSAVRNMTGEKTELDGLSTDNCIKDCPICGGKGVYQEAMFNTIATCPNKGRFEAEKRSKTEIVEQLQASPKVKQAVMQGLVPKKYMNATWDPDKAIGNLQEIANANRLEIDTREAQEYKKTLTLLLSNLARGVLPEFSYMISAPNGSGKANFAYTALKLLVIHGKEVAPYLTLMELAELRKKYMLWAGNLSDKELAINRATQAENYDTTEYSLDTSIPLEKMTNKQKEEYLNSIYKVNFRYTDFLNSAFLVCSMSSDKAQLPLEIAVLKSVLEYRARRCKPTLVFTELQLSTLDFSIAYGDCLDGLYTCTTKSKDYADYDRMFTVSVKPKRVKV